MLVKQLMNNTSPQSGARPQQDKKLYHVPRKNEHGKKNYNWDWDEHKNRLFPKQIEIQTSEFHEETKNYLQLRRHTHATPNESLKIPKAIINREVPQIKKVELIREQIRRIESTTATEQQKIKARLLEHDHYFQQQNQQILREMKVLNPKAKNLNLNMPKLRETIEKHHLKEEEQMALTELNQVKQKMNLLRALEID